MIDALILDIHRASLEDGPGIRTTIFLKGCPMRCRWCHNPESIHSDRELAFFKEKCTLCGACMDACPNQVHAVDNDHNLDRTLCRTCGRCTDVCPYEALKITGVVMSVNEVLKVVLKDISYYEESGGGITVSGGEPMYQTAFTLELLKKAKEKGIHTCLDTSGFAPGSDFGKVIPYVDLFLYDYKVTGSDKHRELTDVPGELIVGNLHLLYEKGARIELRCPLIPGVNDDDDHLEHIAQMKRDFPKLTAVTIMPYHTSGRAKYDRYGYVNSMPGIRSATAEQVMKWNRYLDG
jgi:glycyl-radical enzyme activating protein